MVIQRSRRRPCSDRMRFGGETLAAATDAVLHEVARLGGDGGLIALDAERTIALPFVSAGIKRAALHPDGRIVAAAYSPAGAKSDTLWL